MKVISVAIIIVTFTLSSFAIAEPDIKTGPQCTEPETTANLDFILPDMDGNEIKLSDHLGNVILLDFWATWCGPCRLEIPGFIEMYDKYRTQGLSVLGISVDEQVDAIQSYAQELGMNYPVLVGDGRDDVKNAFAPLYGFPTTFIIDREGHICHKHTGFATREQFEKEIGSLLK